jgi:hypothetical protein
VPVWPIGAISANAAMSCIIREHGASCRHVSPGGGKPNSTSSISHLILELPKVYIPAKFRFRQHIIAWFIIINDRLCGLVFRVSGYRFKGPGFDSRRYQIFWEVVGLERGPLSLVRVIEELLEW